MTVAYHVVCRECDDLEALEPDEDRADDRADAHRDDTGHDVAVGRLGEVPADA